MLRLLVRLTAYSQSSQPNNSEASIPALAEPVAHNPLAFSALRALPLTPPKNPTRQPTRPTALLDARDLRHHTPTGPSRFQFQFLQILGGCMESPRGGALLILTLALLGLPARGDAAPFEIAKSRQQVVFIQRLTPGEPPSNGTGFFLGDTGLIATSRHVVVAEDAALPTTLLVGVPTDEDPDDLEYVPAALTYVPDATDKLDFAVIKIRPRNSKRVFKGLPLQYEKLTLGEDVAALGFPTSSDNEPVLSFNKGSV
ncbi:MAG: serine protease, partial [Planctomycetales bacterium]